MYLSVYLQSASLKRKQFCESSSIFEVGSIKNEAILRDLLNFRSWQHQTRSYSARLPQLLKLATPKTKQSCETDFKNGKLSAGLMASYQSVLRFFHSTCLKYCACHEKLMPGYARSFEVLHLSRKIISSNLQIWCSKMQPISGNQHPNLLTSLMHISFVLRLPREMHLCRSSANVPHLPSFLEMHGNATKPSRSAHFWQGVQSLAPATQNDIWTSKSAPNPWCF